MADFDPQAAIDAQNAKFQEMIGFTQASNQAAQQFEMQMASLHAERGAIAAAAKAMKSAADQVAQA